MTRKPSASANQPSTLFIKRAACKVVDNNEIYEYSGTDYLTVMPAGVAALKNSETVIVMGCTWLEDGLALQQVPMERCYNFPGFAFLF